MIVQHSNNSVEHYTPSPVIHAAWATMGHIDLDPATSESVNTKLVGARQFYTKETNGLNKEWHGNVWLNPPGGVDESRCSVAAMWWEKLVSEWLKGNCKQALFLGFTLEILKTTQPCRRWIGEFPLCFPSKRLDFLIEAESGKFQTQGSPAHSNVIAYLPPMASVYVDVVNQFERSFSAIGKVKV